MCTCHFKHYSKSRKNTTIYNVFPLPWYLQVWLDTCITAFPDHLPVRTALETGSRLWPWNQRLAVALSPDWSVFTSACYLRSDRRIKVIVSFPEFQKLPKFCCGTTGIWIQNSRRCFFWGEGGVDWWESPQACSDTVGILYWIYYIPRPFLLMRCPFAWPFSVRRELPIEYRVMHKIKLDWMYFRTGCCEQYSGLQESGGRLHKIVKWEKSWFVIFSKHY
jgi:hypothetical protein